MEKSLKVIHLVPGLGIGGTEKQVRLLLTHLDPARFSTQLWALKGWGPLGTELERSNIPVKAMGGQDFRSGGALVVRVAGWLKKEQPDILHTWLTPANVIGRLAAQWSLTRIVVSSLRVVEGGKRSHIFLEKLTHPMSQAVTVNCLAVHRFATDRLKIPRNKLTVVPNAAGEDSGEELNPSTSIPPDWLEGRVALIGSAGRLETQKGFPYLLEGFHDLLKTHPEARLVIAGEGSQRSFLQDMMGRMNLTGKARLIGALPSLSGFLRRLRIFTLPSLWEGFPNVLMEAMAAGVPVLATSVGGVEELVTQGQTGIVVPPGNPQALAQALRRLLSSPEEANRLAQTAQAFVKQHHPLSRSLQVIEELYERLAKSGKP